MTEITKIKSDNFTYIELLDCNADDLITLSKDNLLSLNLKEMQAVQDYYKTIRRNPTDVELETIAQTWSEHCKHKTLMGVVEYKDQNGKIEIIDNLLKSTIVEATNKLNKEWCWSVFKDNAGVIEFDKDNGVAFKVETHNHPSALEPYGGAGTGIGGVIRDILGVGLGAKPIFNTDVFCFGEPDEGWDNLPKGVLHPKQIMKGVVEGVRDYGNRMGIPTINGAVVFDEGFTCNPLVYAGTAGIMPKSMVDKAVLAGDYIVAVGGRTGRDGIHGATFSSLALDENTESSAVQIGHPIIEKKILDTLLVARDKGLYRGLTDCGAGGFSSAVGELGEETGVEMSLDKCPLKYQGLKPWEIWVSEAQERMVLAVQPENLLELTKVFKEEDVEVAVLGNFTDTGRLVLKYENDIVCDLDMEFLHGGVPRYKRYAEWPGVLLKTAKYPKIDANKVLLKILNHPNVCSKEWVIRQYDHEVQGSSVIKPIQGKHEGPGDGAVVRPVAESFKGVSVSCGINHEYGKVDPYWMSLANIDEAMRNMICTGGVLERAAFLDNFCWGDPEDKKELAGIVRAAKACHDASLVYGIPFISGKDSLNNTYLDKEGNLLSIPGTLLISSIGVLKDIRKCLTMNLKQSGNLLYLIGETEDELGGSIFNVINNIETTNLPKVDLKTSKKTMDRMNEIIDEELITSIHDCSEGGLAVTLSEMAFAGGMGAEIDISDVNNRLNSYTKLFSESCSRFIVEISTSSKADFEAKFADKQLICLKLGMVNDSKKLLVKDNANICIDVDINDLEKAFKSVKW
ncbi:MAG: phosphoribosylformylglycinamidine synthase subunit PurL [bacterium]|nr:phosphoribosylformylglycinamidine synthase subunit PurL [bacterium]